MITQHPEKQIQEAYRVLKPGSAACFSIWGRKEYTRQFMIPIEAYINLGREPPVSPHMAYFAISDQEALRTVFKEAGFAEDVRMWYQPSNWLFRTAEDYW